MDESGTGEYLTREYGRAPRGVPLTDVKRGRVFRKTNVVAARSGNSAVAPFCYTENTTAALFEIWFKKPLVKAIPRGSTVILDNARFHRKTKLKNLARRHGVRVVFLPPYSPDFNPIEHTWASMKRALRDTARNYQTLEAAIYAYFGLGIS